MRRGNTPIVLRARPAYFDLSSNPFFLDNVKTSVRSAESIPSTNLSPGIFCVGSIKTPMNGLEFGIIHPIAPVECEPPLSLILNG